MKRAHIIISLITLVLFLMVTLSCALTEKVKWGYAPNSQKSGKVILSRLAVDRFFDQVRPAHKEIEKLYGLAVKLQQVNRHYPAIETFKEILQKDPGNIKALNGIAVSFDMIRAYATAAVYYQHALKLDPKLDHVWNNLGYCYFLQNKLDQSIDAYQRAIALQPGLRKYQNNLQLVLARQQRLTGPQGQRRLAQNRMPPSTLPDKNAPKVEKEKGILKPFGNEHAISTDTPTAKRVALKNVKQKRETSARVTDKIHPGPWNKSEAMGPAEFDRRADAPFHKVKKGVDRDDQQRNRVYAEIIPFRSLPPLKTVQSIADIERSKIGIRAKESAASETLLTISSAARASFGYQVFLPKRGKDPLIITTPSVGNQVDSLKHLRKNNRLKSKRAGRKRGLKHITMAANQSSGIQIIGLEVSNGNGIRHLARNVSAQLKNKGVQVSRISNATHFQYPRTKLYYLKGLLGKARKLAKIIPGRQEVIEVSGFEHDYVRIRLVLGRDIFSANLLL